MILLSALAGFLAGAFFGGAVLYLATNFISFFISDKTALGWVWILYIVVMPLTGAFGMVKFVTYSERWYTVDKSK